MKDIFRNISDDTVKKAKEKIDMMLTDKQKSEIIEKINKMDKSDLINILKNANMNNITDEKVNDLLNKLDNRN